MVNDIVSSKSFKCRSLQWDTDYFGVPSARVDLSGRVNEKGQDEIMAFCKGYKFVTISNINNVRENNHWIGRRTKAFLTDLNIQFSKFLTKEPAFLDEKTSVANELSISEQILDIAEKSFLYSRFFNDPQLPEKQARNIYVHWTKCAFGQKDKYFVTTQREGKVAGFILFSFHQDSGIIELIAVDEKYQGQHVGKSLIHAMESFVIRQEKCKIKVGTQVDNLSAINFYSTMGFKVDGCGSMYHLWEQGGA